MGGDTLYSLLEGKITAIHTTVLLRRLKVFMDSALQQVVAHVTLFMQRSISELSEERINQSSGGVQNYTYIQNNSANMK